jgi:hypothetical protein
MTTRRLLWLALLPSVGWANNCEEIRARIDARIKASGAAGYSLVVVEKDATVTGKVVGSCDRGRRRIVYTPRAASAAGAAEDILTECRDGSVTRGGDCPP